MKKYNLKTITEIKSHKTINKIKLDVVGGGVLDDPKTRQKYINTSMSNVPTSNIQRPTSNSAITLIALIITIIVLLILAGITLNLVMGENGIFSKANQAKEKTIKAEMQEAVSMAVQELQIDKLGGATLNDINEEWLKNQELSEKYNAKILKDNNGKKIRLKKNEVSLTCLIDINLNITICKAIGISYIVDKTTFKDNTVNIKITVINDEEGLKQIEMPDGNIIKCNGENEKEIEYTITLGVEYIIKITSDNGKIDNEKIKVDSIPCIVTIELSTGVEISNKSIVTDYGKTYENTITTKGDYVINEITATMDGGNLNIDKTTGRISTEKVTGDIKIIVTTQEMKINITEEVVNTSTSFGGKSEEKNSITAGSNAYIKLKAGSSINGANLTITPQVPYLITKNGNYKFVITAEYNSKKVEIQKNVEVNQFEVASNLVKYDAGKWTKEEIEELKKQKLYNININHIYNKNFGLESENGLNLTFGGFTYDGDNENEEYINYGKIITSRNQSVSPGYREGNPKYSDGWQILTSIQENNKTYVKQLIHVGASENFVFQKASTDSQDGGRAEYILSSGTRLEKYNTIPSGLKINYRNWNEYRDKDLDKKGMIKEIHIMTLEEAKTYGITTSSNKLFSTGASYWLSTALLSYSEFYKSIYYITSRGAFNSYDNSYYDGCMGIRLIVDMEDGVYIDSGTGTQENPYILAKDEK